jgi:hypothetical protein
MMASDATRLCENEERDALGTIDATRRASTRCGDKPLA